MTPTRPVRRLEPRPYATGAYGRQATDYPAERPRSGRAGRRLAIVLAVALLFAAAVAIAVAISASTSNTVVQLRTTVAHDAQSAINQVQNLISQYTK
jgi:predicted PurR-regulated permease PerM